jgi:predicted esterase
VEVDMKIFWLLMSLLVLLQCGGTPEARPAARSMRTSEHRRAELVHREPVFETARYRPAFPTSEELLESDAGLVVALPPVLTTAMAATAAVAAPVPVVFMLHGMCGQPSWSCDAVGAAGRDGSWLVCPSGNVRCGNRYDWKGDGERKAAYLDRAAETLRAAHPSLVAPAGEDVLVGFSRGAFVARDVAYARPGRYKGLVLIGAALTPDPKRLLDSGIRRVVLASGDFDGARPTMIRAAAKLKRGGVETRFVSTGRIWHQLPRDLDAILAPHIAWVRDA